MYNCKKALEKGKTMANITIKKEKFSTVAPIGYSNADFYGWAFNDCKRIGTVWVFKNEGKYVFNEDFDRDRHSRENRTVQCSGKTLKALKSEIAERF